MFKDANCKLFYCSIQNHRKTALVLSSEKQDDSRNVKKKRDPPNLPSLKHPQGKPRAVARTLIGGMYIHIHGDGPGEAPLNFALDVYADLVKCPLKIEVSISALLKNDLIQRVIAHDFTGLYGLW